MLVIGSVACDEVIRLREPMRVGGHNQGYPEGRRIGGGAANTALALAHVGDEARVMSAVRNDELGRWLMDELAQARIDTARIRRDAKVTTHSLVFVDEDGERTIVNRQRALNPLPAPEDWREVDVVYVRCADAALSLVLAQCAKESLVVAHIPPVTPGFRPAQVLVGSEDDLDAEFLSDPWRNGREVAGETLKWVVITHGENGVTAYGEEATLACAAPHVTAVDTTGAGDVFAAGLVHALAYGETMEQALACGAQWGAASVCYEGTVPPPEFPVLA